MTSTADLAAGLRAVIADLDGCIERPAAGAHIAQARPRAAAAPHLQRRQPVEDALDEACGQLTAARCPGCARPVLRLDSPDARIYGTEGAANLPG